MPKTLGSFSKHDIVKNRESISKKKQELMYIKHHRVSNLASIAVGEIVWVIDMRVYGKIISHKKNPNSYCIKTERVSVICRNRWHIIPAPYKSGTCIDKKSDSCLDFVLFLTDPPTKVLELLNENEKKRRMKMNWLKIQMRMR